MSPPLARGEAGCDAILTWLPRGEGGWEPSRDLGWDLPEESPAGLPQLSKEARFDPPPDPRFELGLDVDLLKDRAGAERAR